MTREDIQAIIDRFIEELWNQRRLETADEILASDLVYHEPIQTVLGLSQYRQYLETVWHAFPNARFVQKDLLIDGQKASLRWTLQATHRGRHPSFPVPATGSQIDMAGQTIFRLQNGKIVEIWMETDYSPIFRIVVGVAAAAFAAIITLIISIRFLGQLLQ